MEKRQSRQNIVVPPKGVSATSMIIGAVLCGLAGFAVVWLAGLGRTVSVTQSPMPTASASTTGPSLLEESSPAVRLEPTANLEQSRFSSPAQETYLNPPRGGDYPAQPASFEKPIESKAVVSEKVIEEEQGKDDAIDAEPNHLSRFSAKQISPPEGEVAKQQPAAPKLDEKLDEKNGDSRDEKIAETASAPALTGHVEKINEESTPSVLQQPSEDDELGTKQINEDLVGMREPSAPSPPVSVPAIDNEKEAATPAVSVKDVSIPDQPEVLATEITKTKVPSKTKVTDDVAAATKKADETTLFAKPARETARSKISANNSDKGDLVEAEPTQTGPSTTEPKTPLPSLPALDDAKGNSPPQPLVSTNTEAPLSAQSNPFAAPKQTSEASANDSKKQPLQNTGVTMPFAAAPPLGKQQQDPLNTIDADKKAEPLSKTTPASRALLVKVDRACHR